MSAGNQKLIAGHDDDDDDDHSVTKRRGGSSDEAGVMELKCEHRESGTDSRRGLRRQFDLGFGGPFLSIGRDEGTLTRVSREAMCIIRKNWGN